MKKNLLILAILILGIQDVIAQDVYIEIPENNALRPIANQMVDSRAFNIATRPGNIVYEGRVHVRGLEIDLLAGASENVRITAKLTAEADIDLWLLKFTLQKHFSTEIIGTVKLKTITDDAGNDVGFEVIIDPVRLENTTSSLPDWLDGYINNRLDGYLSDLNTISITQYTEFFPGELTDYFSSIAPSLSVTDSSILVFYKNKIHKNLILKNIQIAKGESALYEAGESIKLAGESAVFYAEKESVSNFSSADKIVLKRGTHLKSGSDAHIYVDPSLNITPAPLANPAINNQIVSNEKEKQKELSEPKVRYLNSVTDSDSLESTNRIDVYPNPVKSKVSINFDKDIRTLNSAIKIYNGIGVEVFQYKITKDIKTVNLNLKSLPMGSYYLKFMNKEKVITKKIIIKRPLH